MSSPAVTVVNYGMGNIWSVRNALSFVGANVVLSADPDEIARAECLILPGVGVFGTAMRRLESLGIRAAMDEAVLRRGIPFLGICIGMQLLASGSEESENVPGLGWIPGRVLRVRGEQLRVPHMGFSAAHLVGPSSELFENIGGESDFYFVHSYHFEPTDPAHVVATTDYGRPFVSVVRKDNILGAQFHPEKSQSNGMQFLANFIGWSRIAGHA
jgi:imidazole glycerol-phosphate synthase subunit HisH